MSGSGAIGYARGAFSLVSVLVNYGADTPAASQTLSLQLIDGSTGKPAAEGFQRDSGLFAMDFLDPATHRLWKAELHAGRADAGFAAKVGAALLRIHAGTADRPDIAQRHNARIALGYAAHRQHDAGLVYRSAAGG